jgi:hypothetical protein
MTIQSRPTPLHPPILTFADLSAWLDKRLESVEEDLADGETAQSMGRQLRERRATLLDVAFAIREAVEQERSDQAADAEYDRWKESYGDDADKLAAYQAEGR